MLADLSCEQRTIYANKPKTLSKSIKAITVNYSWWVFSVRHKSSCNPKVVWGGRTMLADLSE